MTLNERRFVPCALDSKLAAREERPGLELWRAAAHLARLIPVATALAISCLFAAPVLAQTGLTLGPIVGATLGGSTEQGEVVYGGRVTLGLTDDLSVELAALRLTDEPDEERLGVEVTGDADITPVQLSARYAHDLVGERLRGFVAGGVGYYFNESVDLDVSGLQPGGPITQTGNPEVDRDDAFGWHLGAGLEWLATRNLVVTLDYRFGWMSNSAELTGLSANTAAGQEAIRAFEKDFEDNDQLGILSLGLSWRF